MAERTNIAAGRSRIARNTVFLYFRMFLLMLIGLYTSRVVIHALGIEDYGVYGAVGGVVALFSILTGSMSAAISRFLTYELGRKEAHPDRVFSSAVSIQLIISLFVILLSETAGLWWLENKVVVPEGRMVAARWVFQFSVLTFVFQLVSVPYNAVLIAREKMDAFAFIGVIEGLLKLGVAFAIAAAPLDKLIFYAFLMCLVSLIVRLMYGIYCRRRFREARYTWSLDGGLFKEMFAFAGWNFIGAGAGVLRDQGGNQLLNLFFGPAANAAWLVASQVNGAVQKFVTSFVTALNPQITKSLASGEKDYMMRLVFKGSKLSVFLLLLVAAPVLLYADPLLSLWLGNTVPEHASYFVRGVLLLSLIEAVSHTMVTAVLSTGRIRNYQLVVGGLVLLNIPIDYVLIRWLGAGPGVIYQVAVGIALVCLAARILFMRRMLGMDVAAFCRDILSREAVVTAFALLLPRWLFAGMQGSLWMIAAGCALTVLLTLAAIWILGCDRSERSFLIQKIQAFLHR